MARRGRKTLFKDEMIREAEYLGGLGLDDAKIAEFWNVTRSTLWRWEKNHPEFCNALKRGKLMADIVIVKSLFEQAKDGNVTAMIFWLKNRRPDLWRDRKPLVSQTISGEGDIQISTTTRYPEIRQMVSSWTPEQKKRFIEVMRALDNEFKTGQLGQWIQIKREDNDQA